MLFERAKIVDTGTNPASLYLPIAARPAEAMHPHSEQTGRPPDWQGEIVEARSAEIQAVTCAKMHSRGDAGGRKKPSRAARGISTLAYSVRSCATSETTLTRSSAESRSRLNWSSWGVNRLNQIFRASGRTDQNSQNSRK